MRLSVTLLAFSMLSGCATNEIGEPLLAPAPASAREGTPPAVAFPLDAATIDILLDGTLYPAVLTVPFEDDPLDVNTGASVEAQAMCIEQGEQKACFDLQPGVSQRVDFLFEGATYRADFVNLGADATFPADYREEHRGTLRADTSRAYELVNVAIALSESARGNEGLIRPGPYADVVYARFDTLRDHPFVKAIDKLIAEDFSEYHRIKMNGASFDLDAENRLTRSTIYDRVGWGSNALLPLFEEMQDFAVAADFAAFFAEQRPTYDTQRKIFLDHLDAPAMLDWLRAEFPGAEPFDAVRVFFSPLVGHSQSLATPGDGELSELQPHVDVPPEEPVTESLGAEAGSFWRGATLFTELNHGFIDVPADAVQEDIGRLFSCRDPWVVPNSAGDGYPGPRALFVELMNWALISVRARDTLSPAAAAQVAARAEFVMEKKRGFTGFGEFQEEVLAAEDRALPFASSYPALMKRLEARRPTIAGVEKCEASTS